MARQGGKQRAADDDGADDGDAALDDLFRPRPGGDTTGIVMPHGDDGEEDMEPAEQAEAAAGADGGEGNRGLRDSRLARVGGLAGPEIANVERWLQTACGMQTSEACASHKIQLAVLEVCHENRLDLMALQGFFRALLYNEAAIQENVGQLVSIMRTGPLGPLGPLDATVLLGMVIPALQQEDASARTNPGTAPLPPTDASATGGRHDDLPHALRQFADKTLPAAATK